jgi:peroxiredoxin
MSRILFIPIVWVGFFLMGAVWSAQGPFFFSSEGKKVALDAWAGGKPVALVVIKNTDCPVCKRQLLALEKGREAWEKRGAKVAALSHEMVGSLRDYRARLKLEMPVFSDPEMEELKHWQLARPKNQGAIPGVVFFDACGKVAGIIKGRRPSTDHTKIIEKTLEKLVKQGARCQGAS